MDTNYIISNSGTITAVVNGKAYTVETDHKNYEGIKEAVRTNDGEKLIELIDGEKNAVNQFAQGHIEIRDGVLYYQNFALGSSLATRILKLKEENFDIKPMINFVENLIQNPSNRSIKELYTFLDCCGLPITSDGCFLAYKRVRDDYMDFHSGSIRYMVGDEPFMLRGLVDDTKENTCSHGLHFCSLGYLAEFHGGQGKIVIVKINPKDVVSIPVDYNNSKGRTCRMKVIEEYKGADPCKDIWEHSVVADDGTKYVPDADDGLNSDSTSDIEFCSECGDELNDGVCFSCESKKENPIDVPNEFVNVDTATTCQDCGYKYEQCKCGIDEVEGIDVCQTCLNPMEYCKCNGNSYGVKPNGHKFHNRRGSDGKFTKA